jgi:hypothetical protein
VPKRIGATTDINTPSPFSITNQLNYIGMKKTWLILICSGFLMSCAGSKKRGCASTSSNMGAERVLAGEKPDKKSKFKVKQMQ